MTCLLQDHEDYSRNISVPSDLNLNLNLKPIKKPQQTTVPLSVSSFPQGATILIDGNYMGITPLAMINISDGIHQIETDLKGYETQSKTVRLPNISTIHFDLNTIQTSNNTITITTNPSNAEIYIDGYYKGRTPLSIPNVSQGTHVMTCLLQDYEDLSRNISVTNDLNLNLNLTPNKKPQPTHAPISITSYPQGAAVHIDGNYMGVTPLAMTYISDGTHQIEINLKGYETQSKTVRIPFISTVHFDLNKIARPSKKVYPFSITSSPAGAVISIDGKKIGNAPITVSLPIKIYDLKCSLNGYNDVVRQIKIPDNTSSHFSLVKDSKKTQHTHAPVFVTSNPNGADIYLDGKMIGITPQDISSVSFGSHNLLLHLSGYDPVKRIIKIPRDRDISSNLHVKLPPDNSNQSQTPAQNAPISLPLKTSGKNKGLINWALFCIGLLIVGLIVLSITSASYATPKMAPVTDKSATVAVMMPPAVNQSDTVALQTGISLLNSGNYAEALKEFDSALNANPNSVAAWNYKGFSLFKLGRYNESIQASDKAVALDQNYTAAWTQKAIVTIY
jgi:hypothetical protein